MTNPKPRLDGTLPTEEMDMKIWLMALPLALVALAGCAGNTRELEVHTTSLSYDGNETGDHEKTGDCDQDGLFSGSGNIEDGRVHVELVDGKDNTVYDRTFDSDFSFASDAVAGQDGRWTVKADRQGNDLVGDQFKGSYSFTLTC
jgi:hypothetical protein